MMSWDSIALLLLGAAIGIPATVITTRILEKRHDLRFVATSSGDLVPKNKRFPLEIRYDGLVVTNLVELRLRLTNHGGLPIEHLEFTWEIPNGKLASWTSSDDGRALMERPQEGEIVLLNPGEYVDLTLIVANEPSPVVRFEARGPGIVAREDRPLKYARVVVTVVALLEIIGLSLLLDSSFKNVLAPAAAAYGGWVLIPFFFVIVGLATFVLVSTMWITGRIVRMPEGWLS